MAETKSPNLQGVSETLLITLAVKARESQRPDAMLKDDVAVELVRKLDCDFSRYKLQEHDEIALIMRVREFDGHVREFLARHPDGAVVHIGCGLDARFERVDNGQVEWFDLDMPGVIALRRELIGGEKPRYHLLSSSVFDDGWFEAVSVCLPRPFLFFAVGVFPFFEEARIKALFLKLRERFPGCEVVCDAHTPFVLFMDNLQLAFSKVRARLHWGLKHGRDVEKWAEGIVMLSEWFYFNTPEPRMAAYKWMGSVPVLGKSTGIFHYRLD